MAGHVMIDGPTPSRSAGAPVRLLGTSMSLLDEIWRGALDRDYAEASRRAPGPVRRGGVLVAAFLVILGLLAATAVVQVRRRAPAAAQVRQALVAEIDQRTTDTDRLQEGVEALRTEVTQARREALRVSDTGEALDEEVGELELSTGVVAVTGPGLRVVVDDAEPSAVGGDPPASGGVDATRVLDRDLQVLVNGLWQAGAEAVAINGQRITALTAIRSAGDAILVDYRPLSPPYTVEAVGDQRSIEPAFVDGAAGRELRTVKETFGIRFDVSAVDRLELPAGSGVTLRYAEVKRR
jgi:uncharacterized protein YlxW (UPF0749 family)